MKTSIFDLDNWREIGATLARNKTRTLLTAFGIFWGTAMLALLFGGASGFEGIMRRNFAGLTTNLGGVSSNRRTVPYRGFTKGSGWQMTMRDVEQIRATAPAIEFSSEQITRSGNVAYGAKSKSATIMGVGADYSKILIPVVKEGRFLNESDIAQQRKVTVLGHKIATALFGNASPLGEYVNINGIYFLVVGVASQQSDVSVGYNLDDSATIPSSTMRKAYNMGDRIHFFTFTAPAGHQPMENENAIRRVLCSAHSISPDDASAIEFMNASEMFDVIDKLFLGIRLLALFVGFGSLLAGVIGVANIMWIVVKERTQEFGIRRAIGATPFDITVQVLSESILLTLIAGALGVCFAALILAIVDKTTADPMLGKAGFELSFRSALVIVGTFFLLGSAAGTLPAIKAMKIKPIEAINDK